MRLIEEQGNADESKPAAAVANWLSSRNADDFPYDAVVAEFHRVGKHFVATELLEALAGVRAALPEVRGSVTSVRLLDRFLDAALDKWDGRYANPTYLGLSLLPLPAVDDLEHHDVAAAQRQYDRLFVQLIADAIAVRARRGGRRDGAAAADAAGCPHHRETLPAGPAGGWAGRAASGIG